MNKVRFKAEYSDSKPRIAYELVSEEPETFHLDHPFKGTETEVFYNVKLIGYVPTYKMENADGSEVDAIDVFSKLSNL